MNRVLGSLLIGLSVVFVFANIGYGLTIDPAERGLSDVVIQAVLFIPAIVIGTVGYKLIDAGRTGDKPSEFEGDGNDLDEQSCRLLEAAESGDKGRQYYREITK